MEIREGDNVRVTTVVAGTVTSISDDKTVQVAPESTPDDWSQFLYYPLDDPHTTFEVLTANRPEEDKIGALRARARDATRPEYVKLAPNHWASFSPDGIQSSLMTNDDVSMNGTYLLGATPGTPAAEHDDTNIPLLVWDRIWEHYTDGHPIKAIKTYREHFAGSGLQEARDTVENFIVNRLATTRQALVAKIHEAYRVDGLNRAIRLYLNGRETTSTDDRIVRKLLKQEYGYSLI